MGTPKEERRLTRLQAVTGLAFAVFLVVHIANSLLAAKSAEAYDEFQASARTIYQQPAVEYALILIPLAVHMAIAVMRIVRRRGTPKTALPLRLRLHRWTGYFLLLVIIGHIFATRGSSAFFDVYPGAAGLSFSLWWVPWVFYPYYTLLCLCGAYHGLNGFWLALRYLGTPVPTALTRGWPFWLPLAATAGVWFFALAGLGGHRYEIDDPTQNGYAQLYEKHLGVSLEE